MTVPKYATLTAWLREYGAGRLSVTFAELDRVVGGLPLSARKTPSMVGDHSATAAIDRGSLACVAAGVLSERSAWSMLVVGLDVLVDDASECRRDAPVGRTSSLRAVLPTRESPYCVFLPVPRLDEVPLYAGFLPGAAFLATALREPAALFFLTAAAATEVGERVRVD